MPSAIKTPTSRLYPSCHHCRSPPTCSQAVLASPSDQTTVPRTFNFFELCEDFHSRNFLGHKKSRGSPSTAVPQPSEPGSFTGQTQSPVNVHRRQITIEPRPIFAVGRFSNDFCQPMSEFLQFGQFPVDRVREAVPCPSLDLRRTRSTNSTLEF